MAETPAILFVCLGNICRSPMAEGTMRALAEARGVAVEIDSAGTGNWHVGDPPDPRAIAEMARHGVDISGLRGRQATRADFDRFDHIIALDRQNLADLKTIAPQDARAELSLLLDHVEGRAGEPVADPWFGEADGFSVTYADVRAGAEALLDKLA
ncbi:low molecular weight protein-tyrosine-phosphatase [Paracoccaceae bacterium GXU_MW_L88]